MKNYVNHGEFLFFSSFYSTAGCVPMMVVTLLLPTAGSGLSPRSLRLRAGFCTGDGSFPRRPTLLKDVCCPALLGDGRCLLSPV